MIAQTTINLATFFNGIKLHPTHAHSAIISLCVKNDNYYYAMHVAAQELASFCLTAGTKRVHKKPLRKGSQVCIL